MKQFRSIVLVASLLLAMLPVAAQAAANDQVIAENKAAVKAAKQQANIANDLARCQLAAKGIKVPGHVGASQPGAAAGCAGSAGVTSEIKAPQTLASGTPAGCPAVGRALTRVEKAAVNDFLTTKAKAEGKGRTPPTPSPEVLVLLACS